MPIEIIVVPNNPRWKEMFAMESKLVLIALGDNALSAYHIGSTAIPTIAAKPIIDILVVVANIDEVDDYNAAMENLGYEAMGEFGIPTRRYFRKDSEHGIRTHHVHVFPQGSDQIDRHLAFRDFMNQHADWAQRYSELKIELSERHPDSIEKYMAGKDGFIKHVDELAAAWRRSSTPY